ncbi:MAG: rod-binding protein [Deltaproteobacteria bacterium]|nr:rod-binding protein [Deltaproteobacteria bacterium]
MADNISIPAESSKIKVIGQSADKRTKDEGLKAACAEFESLFIYQLLKMMRGAVPKTPLFHGGPGEDIYTSMFDQEVARKMSEDRGIGLGKQLYEQVSEAVAKTRRNEIPGSIGREGLKDKETNGVNKDGAQKR